jgi:hypothetical protein
MDKVKKEEINEGRFIKNKKKNDFKSDYRKHKTYRK